MNEENEEKMTQGTCRFCGQSILLNPEIGWTEEDIEEAATKKCSCSEAKSYVRKIERKKKVDAYIKETFNESAAEAVRTVIAAVEGFDFEKVTIKDVAGWQTSIYLDKDSYLNIKRKATKIGRELKA